jgi:hypothetical protein
MRLVAQIAVLMIIATTAIADPAATIVSRPPSPKPPHYWILELIQQSGDVTRFGWFATKEACETAVPRYEQEEHGYNGHCIEHKEAK